MSGAAPSAVTSARAFLDDEAPPAAFEDVAAALRAGLALRFDIGADEARLSVSEDDAFSMTGRWNADHLARAVGYGPVQSAAVPLFFEPVRVTLPARALSTIKVRERPLVNTMVRNVFNACVRREELTLERAPDGVNACARVVPTRYLWLLRGELSDPALEGHRAADRLFVEAHLRVTSFERAFLARAFAELRGERVSPEARFARARETMMAVL